MLSLRQVITKIKLVRQYSMMNNVKDPETLTLYVIILVSMAFKTRAVHLVISSVIERVLRKKQYCIYSPIYSLGLFAFSSIL